MSTMIDRKVFEAVGNGWAVRAVRDDAAILHYPGHGGTDGTFHLIMIVMAFMSCGAWLAVYLPLWFFLDMQAVPAQTLHLSEVDGHVEERVVKA